MWPITLSGRLPIADLVGRYLTNYLIGRELTSYRIAPLTSASCGAVVLSGISTPFGALSPCGGQVAHALLTRPPLELIDSIRRLPQQVPARLACVRHAASVRPEPGSNSYVQSVIALDLWKNSSLSEPVLLKHDSLKILDCSCVLSLFCIVFKVRCSQASLYIIPRTRFFVNTFFQKFLIF